MQDRRSRNPFVELKGCLFHVHKSYLCIHESSAFKRAYLYTWVCGHSGTKGSMIFHMGPFVYLCKASFVGTRTHGIK